MKINKKTILLAVGVFLLGFHGSKAQAADANMDNFSLVVVADKKELMSLMTDSDVKQTFTHEDWNKRDPFNISAFQASEDQEIGKKAFVLQGIFLGSNKPSVIINGTVAGLGSRIHGSTINEIKDNTVTLVDDNGNQTVLSLKK